MTSMTAADVRKKGHSWRDHAPEDIVAIIENRELQNADRDNLTEAQGALRFIEAGRFEPFLEATSDFFFRLDRDEQQMFLRRNPDVVEWMTVWNQAHDFNPYTGFRETARENMGGDPQEALNPPPFERGDLPDDRTLLNDMMFRRRSYRNWTPGEFEDIMDREEIEITRGIATELDIFTPEARQEIDFPVDEYAENVARKLFERIEAGRFDTLVAEAQEFFNPLDSDERRAFALRNPGIIMWMSARGRSQHMPHGEQLFPFSDGVLPTLEERS
jgi:hypothetical protein